MRLERQTSWKPGDSRRSTIKTILAKADETAKTLARKPAEEPLRACKKLIKAPDRESLDQAVRRELSEFAVRVRSAEAKEAFTAFLEKRKPVSSTMAKAS